MNIPDLLDTIARFKPEPHYEPSDLHAIASLLDDAARALLARIIESDSNLNAFASRTERRFAQLERSLHRLRIRDNLPVQALERIQKLESYLNLDKPLRLDDSPPPPSAPAPAAATAFQYSVSDIHNILNQYFDLLSTAPTSDSTSTSASLSPHPYLSIHFNAIPLADPTDDDPTRRFDSLVEISLSSQYLVQTSKSCWIAIPGPYDEHCSSVSPIFISPQSDPSLFCSFLQRALRFRHPSPPQKPPVANQPPQTTSANSSAPPPDGPPA